MLFAIIQGRGTENLNQGSVALRFVRKAQTQKLLHGKQWTRSEVQFNVVTMRKGASRKVLIIDHSQIKDLGSKCLETLVFWMSRGCSWAEKVFSLCTKGMTVARGWKEGRGAEGSLKYRPIMRDWGSSCGLGPFSLHLPFYPKPLAC